MRANRTGFSDQASYARPSTELFVYFHGHSEDQGSSNTLPKQLYGLAESVVVKSVASKTGGSSHKHAAISVRDMDLAHVCACPVRFLQSLCCICL